MAGECTGFTLSLMTAGLRSFFHPVALSEFRNARRSSHALPGWSQAQRTSVSFLRKRVKKDPKAPVIVGRGMIACNTPALQEW